jgi:hypothetical protein
MSFRFCKQIKIAPGLAIDLSQGWPSLSISGLGPTNKVARGGPRTTFGSPGTGMNWQFAGQRHIHNAVQVQAEVKAVHAQGTVKAVQAQAEIISITKEMESVAKRLTKNAVGSTYWQKAAIEQTQLLDRMLEIAKASGNDQLIAAVQKCREACLDGKPHFEPSNEESAIWKTVGRSLVLPVIGSALIAVAGLVAARKATPHPPIPKLPSPTPEQPEATPPSQRIAAAATPEEPMATPAPEASTPVPTPAPAATAPLPEREVTHGKAIRDKHAVHTKMRRPGP